MARRALHSKATAKGKRKYKRRATQKIAPPKRYCAKCVAEVVLDGRGRGGRVSLASLSKACGVASRLTDNAELEEHLLEAAQVFANAEVVLEMSGRENESEGCRADLVTIGEPLDQHGSL